MRRTLRILSISASLLALQFAVVGLVSDAHATSIRVARIAITADYDPGVAYFDVLANENKDLTGIVYTSPTLPEPLHLSFYDIVRPNGHRSGQGGTILFWRKGRPVVILVANDDSLDRRHGGEISLKYLHNGRKENNLKFKTLPMRLVREGDRWKILTDDHSTVIRSLCFREKTYWGFTVGADRHEINRSCPKS